MLSRVFMMIMAFFSATTAFADSAIQIDGAYVREPIPGRYMSAAFMNIKNDSAKEKILVSAKADWAGLIEIHTHIHDNGVMRMRQMMELTIPAGESVSLQPGGLHLMLFKLELPLSEKLPLTLCFKDGSCETTTAVLRSLK
ncbi:copper chaperone PCu(A)C [Bacterioplanoides sp. SCSIO 12839]|uniref:copper chaperone PCu(A)C n=1 Tax=Bacterioplanoides sp. SCSIO 12839 TaxID=2829569 RepID=UPI002103AE52|nr:copper chaperone PCu(A)C [Bacterioplanoides sp. SCSIO 12839]UTW47753.1 copper chaperone PCu(A)C [Bacterioplanoides sp. SCSIO 12839]